MRKIIRNPAGQYLVKGSGFVGTAAQATSFSPEDLPEVLECCQSMGIKDATVEDAPVNDKSVGGSVIQNKDGSSYAVRFVRPKDVRSDGSIASRKRRYSPRRFRTEAEAKHHGARFSRIEGHVGFVVGKVIEPVNAWVNEFTGRTNPEIGKKRTDRQ